MSFLVLGEALVDLIAEAGSWRFEAVPGGSPLNVAVGLAAAGQPVRLASRVGEDMFGALVREHLHAHGVDRSELEVSAAPTGLAISRVDAHGNAGYEFRGDTRWVRPVTLAGASWLHVGSLGALLEPGAAAVRAAVTAAGAQGIPVSYDPNLRPTMHGGRAETRPLVERLVAGASVVKASEEDLAWLYPGTPPRVSAAGWATAGPWLVIVTHGAAGSTALYQEQVVECAAPAVEVVDTVGAGDAFTAGLLAALARRAGVAEALRWASATAAAVCQQRGAGPPRAATVEALYAATPPPRRAG